MAPPKQDPVTRFWAKVAKSAGCWEWRGTTSQKGYGRFAFGPRQHTVGAHRFSYAIAHGVAVADFSTLQVCHRCDNPRCVRPEHLFLGTPTDNVRDSVAKGRMRNGFMGRTHCANGHAYTPENTRTPRGHRECRECHNAYNREGRRRRQGAA